jgi:muramoyltetrapeptide carboxypeptidase
MEILKPNALKPGSTIGIFTPSAPAYRANEGLFANGVENLKKLGFQVKLGSLTDQRGSEGYRSGTAQERAAEFMELINDSGVDALMSTIGGSNSSSLIPFLDFFLIRSARKLVCGFSDVTSLHLAILKLAGLRTLYGPSVMCWFGDWPDGIPESTQWFLEAAMKHRSGDRQIQMPARWSNHSRDWANGDWKTKPREWIKNDGWRTLSPGTVTAPILAFNLNTLASAAGTPYWPDFKDRLLLIEDMEAPFSRTERLLRQLKFNGVFDQIAGLIIGKPEFLKTEGAPFSYDDLLKEVIGPRAYPIVSNFDCGHCVPMIAIPQLTPVTLEAGTTVSFTFRDGFVA